MSNDSEISVEIFENPTKIIQFLPLGTRLPVEKRLENYILHDLKLYDARSIICFKSNTTELKPVGHVLVFNLDKDTLYFGFFGVVQDQQSSISILIRELVKYAKEYGFKRIEGPINIPTIIYGWGFLNEGGDTTPFIGKPINPPIYQKIFIKNNFRVKAVQISREGPISDLQLDNFRGVNLENYEIYQPKTWDEVRSLKYIFLRLFAINMPSNSVLTPEPEKLFDKYLEFLKEFGDLFLLIFVRYKPNDEIVGAIIDFPNIFYNKVYNKYNGIVNFALAINREHRKGHVSLLLGKQMIKNALKNGVSFMSSTYEERNIATDQLTKNYLNHEIRRKHLILEYNM